MSRTIVWTSVVATLAGLGSLVSAVAGSLEFVIPTGLIAVTSALLASREK